jgi:hypothetical protein
MKNIKKIVFVGVIGMMMTAGLVLVGCKEDCPWNGDCSYNSATGDYKSCGSSACDEALDDGGSCNC